MRMRPVRGVHDPQREAMTRSVICVGCRPMTGPHLASSCGNAALIAAAACRLRSSVQIWERSKYGWTFVPAWPGVADSRTTDITGFRTTGNASIMAAGTSYTTTSVLEAGALVQCHDGAPLRLSHALLLGENPRMSLFDEIRNATLAHPHRCGDFDAAARRFDAQIQVFDGFARQVQMDAINIQRLPGGSGPNGFRRTGLRSGGLTTAIRHASHSRTTADNDGGPPGT
jgi:hypothetical protein